MQAPGYGYPDYEQVLTWVIEVIAQVVEARLGPVPLGEEFELGASQDRR